MCFHIQSCIGRIKKQSNPKNRFPIIPLLGCAVLFCAESAHSMESWAGPGPKCAQIPGPRSELGTKGPFRKRELLLEKHLRKQTNTIRNMFFLRNEERKLFHRAMHKSVVECTHYADKGTGYV